MTSHAHTASHAGAQFHDPSSTRKPYAWLVAIILAMAILAMIVAVPQDSGTPDGQQVQDAAVLQSPEEGSSFATDKARVLRPGSTRVAGHAAN